LLKFKTVSYELQQIIDCIDAHIYWKDSHGNYLACNKAITKFHAKCNAKEILGQTDDQLFPEQTASMVRKHDLEIMSSKKTTLYDLYF
jgi:transcriptional regulator with PAS, ATPase and Fis domain